jgi:hypothetical protein
MLALLLAATLATQQQPIRVDASLSAERVSPGEVVVYRLSVETDGAPAELRAPDFPPGIEVVRTQDFTESRIAFPGGRRRVQRREFVLLAAQPGVFRIPAGAAVVDGREYPARALSLAVVGATPGAGGGPLSEPRFLVRLNPDTVYVGQEVLLDAEARFPEAHRARRTRPPHFTAPSPSGFWIQERARTVTTSARVEGGQLQEVLRYRRAYFPLTEGRYVLEPAVLSTETRAQLFGAPTTVRLQSDSLRLVVLPLPDAGRPPAFAGAVGRFEIDARLESARVAAGEAVVLHAEVRGRGHIKALPAPALPALAGIEVVSRSEDSEIEEGDGPIAGVKRFRWVLAADSAGLLSIPPLEYPFFDPDAGRYEVALSQPLELDVDATAATAVQRRSEADTLLREIRVRPGAERLAWTRSPLFRTAQALPFLFLALGAGVALRRRLRSRAAPPAPADPLDLSAVEARDGEAALAALHTALATVIRRAGATPDDATNASALRATLEADGYGAQAAHTLAQLWFDVLAARYARQAGPVALDALIERTRRALRLPRQQRGPGAAAGGAALLVLLLAAPPAAAQTHTDFERAVEAYVEGRYEDAVRGFQAHIDAARGDAAAWYNLGNAWLRTGDRGRATWAWSRALALAPRDGDARHNLRTIGAGHLAAEVRPTVPLTSREVELIATLALWAAILLAALAAAARRRSGGRAAYRAAAAAGVAAVVLFATAWRLEQRFDGRAVIVEPGTPLLAGPAFREEVLDTLGEAQSAAIVEARGDWSRVRVHGREGWVDSRAIARLR